MCGSQYLGACGGVDRSDVSHPVPVNVWCDLVVEVLLILDDPGDLEPTPTPAGDFDGVGGALIWVDSSEEQQMLTGTRMDCESVDFDAVVNGRGVVQVRVSV